MQAVAQYLINVNVWTHNLLVLLSRHGLISKRMVKHVRARDHDGHAHGDGECHAHGNGDDHHHDHPLDAEHGHIEDVHEAHDGHPTKSTDHCRWWVRACVLRMARRMCGVSDAIPVLGCMSHVCAPTLATCLMCVRRWWAGTSCFVVLYSYIISVTLPFFSTLVSSRA